MFAFALGGFGGAEAEPDAEASGVGVDVAVEGAEAVLDGAADGAGGEVLDEEALVEGFAINVILSGRRPRAVSADYGCRVGFGEWCLC